MPTALSASMSIATRTSYAATAPHTGALGGDLVNAEGGRFWRPGTGNGLVDREYRRDGVLAAAATHSYNTLAAGGLLDVYSQAIDLDEMMSFELKCETGAIKLVASAGTPIGFLLAVADGIKLSAGQTFGIDLGALGLNVTVNSLFEITDTFGGVGSTYSLIFVGSN